MKSQEQKIIPYLWYDNQAVEAAKFYVSVFPDSMINSITTLRDTPSGDSEFVSFELWGLEFMAFSAGPLFKFNPSVSFMVNFDPLLFGSSPSAVSEAREKIDQVWEKLSEGGEVLMPLDEYPFSKRFGWIQDKYGLSWQLILTDPEGEPRPAIMPSLLFVGDNYGKADEAINFYLSVFKNARLGSIFRYGAGQEPDREGMVQFADFQLENVWMTIGESAHEHKFAFTEAISLMVCCDNQDEIDYYWDKLSAVPEAEQCGWLKDKFGLSWQVSPAELDKKMLQGTDEQVARVTRAFLPMKKLDLATLQLAYEGESVK